MSVHIYQLAHSNLFTQTDKWANIKPLSVSETQFSEVVEMLQHMHQNQIIIWCDRREEVSSLINIG